MKNQEGQTPYDLATADDVKALLEAAMPQFMQLSLSTSKTSLNGDNNSSQLSNGLVSLIPYLLLLNSVLEAGVSSSHSCLQCSQ